MSGLIKLVAAVSLALGIGAVTAYADGPAAKTVSIEQLGQMLEGLGYEPSALKDDKGATFGFNVPMTSGNLTFQVMLQLVNGKRYIYASIGLTKIFDPAAIPATAMQKLMQANAGFTTAHFALQDNGLVVLQSVMSVDLITPANFKSFLEGLGRLIQDNEKLWSKEALGQQPALKS